MRSLAVDMGTLRRVVRLNTLCLIEIQQILTPEADGMKYDSDTPLRAARNPSKEG